MLSNNFKIRQYGIIVKNTMQGPRRGASKVVKRSQHIGITMPGPIIMRPSLRMGETEPAERRGASIEAYQRERETDRVWIPSCRQSRVKGGVVAPRRRSTASIPGITYYMLERQLASASRPLLYCSKRPKARQRLRA